MRWLDRLAEERIRAAAARGELSGLSGEGRPLNLAEDPLVPEDLRAVYRVLKNAGFLPPEMETLRERQALLAHLRRAQGERPDTETARQLYARLLTLELILEQKSVKPVSIPLEYRRKMLESLARRHGKAEEASRQET
ncbi:MAG: DUF1992 domain-containing protein [Zoogloeaceae bacterium]|jgi:hypothetical protein|nr:DUF1992 domain-containing protein [Zoogloeaceae bacterium]